MKTLTTLSFLHAIGLSVASCPSTALFPLRRGKAFHDSVTEELLQERVVSSRHRRNPRGVKRKMSNFPLRPRHAKPLSRIDIRKAIWIIK